MRLLASVALAILLLVASAHAGSVQMGAEYGSGYGTVDYRWNCYGLFRDFDFGHAGHGRQCVGVSGTITGAVGTSTVKPHAGPFSEVLAFIQCQDRAGNPRILWQGEHVVGTIPIIVMTAGGLVGPCWIGVLLYAERPVPALYEIQVIIHSTP